MGDYGQGDIHAKIVAEKFNAVAEEMNMDFVIGLGDNFYDPDGVSGVDDPSWNTKWADIYQNKSYLKDMTWYGTIGNHDYNNVGLLSEFEYNKYGWRIDDFFWTHTSMVGSKSIAFIHIDINFLAYGEEGSDSQPMMKQWFQKFGWRDDQQILNLVDVQLKQYKDYDWKVVIAHHPVGYSCPKKHHTYKILPLLDKYKVDIYLSGHKHQLSYSYNDQTAFLLSGAGFDETSDSCQEESPVWSKGKINGFLMIKIQEDQLITTANYIKYKDVESNDWKVQEMPLFQKKHHISDKQQQQLNEIKMNE